MKLLGCVLGFELGDESDLSSKMETDSKASSAKKEPTTTTTTSKPTTNPNTSTAKPTEQNKNLTPEQNQVSRV